MVVISFGKLCVILFFFYWMLYMNVIVIDVLLPQFLALNVERVGVEMTFDLLDSLFVDQTQIVYE